MERAKETKSARPKSASNVSSDDSDDDEGSTGGLSARAGSAIARPSAGGGGVSYEEFNVYVDILLKLSSTTSNFKAKPQALTEVISSSKKTSQQG